MLHKASQAIDKVSQIMQATHSKSLGTYKAMFIHTIQSIVHYPSMCAHTYLYAYSAS